MNVEATRFASCVDRRLRARLDSERETCDALRLELAESKRGHQGLAESKRGHQELAESKRGHQELAESKRGHQELAESKRGHQSQQQRDSKKLNGFSSRYACDNRY